MNAKEWNALKVGDNVYHKHFGLCKVVSFVSWEGVSQDPCIMPETEEGRSILHRLSGMADTPTLETSKRLLNKTPFKHQSK
jgi:hypothetical protein